jgi:hypothetical protein
MNAKLKITITAFLVVLTLISLNLAHVHTLFFIMFLITLSATAAMLYWIEIDDRKNEELRNKNKNLTPELL